jgi:hypothetical protein
VDEEKGIDRGELDAVGGEAVYEDAEVDEV